LSAPSMPKFNGIPAIGLGTYPLQGQNCTDSVLMALELGYRHIDTAQMYGNERDVGRAIAGSGIKRDALFVTTKVDPSNLGAARFAGSVQRSMDDLGGPADLLLIHWPPPDAEIDATLDRLKAELDRGMARRIGISNFTPRMMRQAVKRLGPIISCNQVEFHPLLDQTLVKATADELGFPLVAYSPIGRGKALQHPAISEIAARLARPASEIVLRWIMQQGVISIPMTTKRANAASNLNILSFALSEADMATISAIGTRRGRMVSGWMTGRWDS